MPTSTPPQGHTPEKISRVTRDLLLSLWGPPFLILLASIIQPFSLSFARSTTSSQKDQNASEVLLWKYLQSLCLPRSLVILHPLALSGINVAFLVSSGILLRSKS